MDDLFSEYVEKFVVIYLNNIVVYSEDIMEHEGHVRLVLEKLFGSRPGG